jgi:hypothetical protein
MTERDKQTVWAWASMRRRDVGGFVFDAKQNTGIEYSVWGLSTVEIPTVSIYSPLGAAFLAEGRDIVAGLSQQNLERPLRFNCWWEFNVAASSWGCQPVAA